MRIGVFLLAAGFPGRSHSDVLDSTVAAAVAAEEAGFDDVWVAEHHFMTYGLCPSAVTLAGYLLGATHRITVGTAVAVLATRHPVALAEEALLLDQVSGGRFALGVGRGGPWVDLEVFGGGVAAHHDAFGEPLALLLAALRGAGVGSGTVAGAGPRYRFREVPVVPAPRTAPHPPVTLAVTSPTGVHAAARHGLPMLLGMHADDAQRAAFVAAYRDAGGPPGAPHVAAAVAHVADTRAEALATLRASLPRWLGPGLAGYVRVDGTARSPRDPHEYTELLCRLHAVGTPADAVSRLRASARATGVDHVLLLVEGVGDRVRTLENVRRLGAEVLPAVRCDRAAPEPPLGTGATGQHSEPCGDAVTTVRRRRRRGPVA